MTSQNNFDSRGKKGFSLVEVVVSMTLIVVVMTLAVSFISLVASFSSREQSDYKSSMEYSSAISILDEFKDTYSVHRFSLFHVTNSVITIIDEDENHYTLSYIKNSNKLVAEILKNGEVEEYSLNLDKISNISFEERDNIVSVTIEFFSFPLRHYLLNFGAVL